MVHHHSLTLTSHELAVASPPLSFTNLPEQDSTNFTRFIAIWHTRKAYSSLWSHATSISAPHIDQSFHCDCELQNFKQIFYLNGYPASLIDNCIRIFLDKIFSPKPPVHSCSKKILSFAFYTMANMVYKYAHSFTNYVQKLTHIFLFVLSFVLRVDCLTFFHSRTEFLLQWDRMLCINISVNAVAHVTYVGQTRRHIHTRISEHVRVSSKTGSKLSVSQMSAVLTHNHLSKHTISDSDFTVLTSGNSKFDLEMRESLRISKLKPIFNNNISSMPALYLF